MELAKDLDRNLKRGKDKGKQKYLIKKAWIYSSWYTLEEINFVVWKVGGGDFLDLNLIAHNF